MVLRAKSYRGIYCLFCKIGARKPTTCLLVSFAAQGPDVHDPLRFSGWAYKLLERSLRKGYLTRSNRRNPARMLDSKLHEKLRKLKQAIAHV